VLEIGYRSAGLFDDQDSRRDIPRFQTQFPEAVETTASNETQIQCGTAAASDALGGNG